MTTVLVLLSMVASCVGWGKLADSMRLNGHSWWARHLAGSTVGFWAFLGFLFILDGFGITLDDTPSSGTSGFFSGVLLTLPLVISLHKSLKASQSERAARSLRSEKELADQRKAKQEKRAAQQQGKTSPTHSLQETLQSNRDAARSAVSSGEWKKKAAKAKHNEIRLPGDWDMPSSTRGRSTSRDGSKDRTLSFVYTDASGNQTHREVSSWHFDGTYIRGFCLTREAIRSFHRDRIDYFLSGEDLLEETAAPRSRPPKKFRPSEAAFEILFTGFAQSEKQQLESDARDAGMVVRKNISKNLSFLCAGPNARQGKMDSAAEKGATILDQDAFEDLLETGSLPN